MNKLVIVAIMWCVLVVVGCDAKKQPPPPQSDVIELKIIESKEPQVIPPTRINEPCSVVQVPDIDPAVQEAWDTGSELRIRDNKRFKPKYIVKCKDGKK